LPKTDWKKQLLEFLEDKRASAGIVYCLSRKETERVAAWMVKHHFNAIAYHAGQDNDLRKINQDRFMTEPGAVMAATIAFGMGIDKPDIRFVVHTSLPGNMETYYQEIGRAGRDGAPAETLVLYGLNDLYQRRRFIQQDGDDQEHQFREHKRLDALLAYCEASSCRRRTLLSYFGDDSDDCGNCDNCLNPPELIDGTTTAVTLITSVHQTGQSFGQAHVIDVVRGANTQKILERGHHEIESFGAGQEHSKAFWQQFLRQLLSAGYLTVNIERYGRIEITATGFGLLRGETTFEYQAIRESTGSKTPLNRKVPRGDSGIPTTDDDQVLLAELKAKRLALAATQGVPAFVVFSDATLIDMVNQKPQTREDFAQINGVGPKKLAQYSDAFLALLTSASS
jgi:ATP-dependent DNA helicase RecQ